MPKALIGKKTLFVRAKYIIKGKVGDELSVFHPGFETVFYTLKSNEDIKILVEDYYVKKKSNYSITKTIAPNNYNLINMLCGNLVKLISGIGVKLTPIQLLKYMSIILFIYLTNTSLNITCKVI